MFHPQEQIQIHCWSVEVLDQERQDHRLYMVRCPESKCREPGGGRSFAHCAILLWQESGNHRLPRGLKR